MWTDRIKNSTVEERSSDVLQTEEQEKNGRKRNTGFKSNGNLSSQQARHNVTTIRKGKMGRKIFEEIIADKLAKWIKSLILIIKNHHKLKIT